MTCVTKRQVIRYCFTLTCLANTKHRLSVAWLALRIIRPITHVNRIPVRDVRLLINLVSQLAV